jgi:hypothetical protein
MPAQISTTIGAVQLMVFSFRCVSGPGALPDKSNLGLATIKYKASDVYCADQPSGRLGGRFVATAASTRRSHR